MALYLQLYENVDDYPYDISDRKMYSELGAGGWTSLENPISGGSILYATGQELNMTTGGTYTLPYNVEYTGEGYYEFGWRQSDVPFRGKYQLDNNTPQEWDWKCQTAINTGHSPFYSLTKVGDGLRIYIRADVNPLFEHTPQRIYVYDSGNPEENKLIQLDYQYLQYVRACDVPSFLPEPVPGVAYVDEEVHKVIYNAKDVNKFPPLEFTETGTCTWESVGFTTERYQAYVDEVLGLNPVINEILNVKALGTSMTGLSIYFFDHTDLFGLNYQLRFTAWGEYNGLYGEYVVTVDYVERTITVTFEEYDG